MIHSYIIELENRLNNIKELIGDLPENYDVELKAAKQKIEQVVQKTVTNKEVQHKYNKINSFMNRHNDILDNTLTADKVNVVLDELEDLREVSESLNKIEKLLPAIDTSQYVKQRDKYEKLYLLRTGSEVSLDQNGGIKVENYEQKALVEIQEEQRKQMSALMQLNYRMLNNLNEKIKLAYERKKKK